jgi:thiol:disulfide interchange protein DsbA
MKKIALMGTLVLLGWMGTAAAQPFQEGVHYTKFVQADAPRNSDVITVTEIFSYACHACNDFEPFMQNWKGKQQADVKLSRIAVGFGRPSWEILAQGYTMAEILGVEEENHVKLMDSIWKEGRWNRGSQLRSIEQIADFYEEQGVDREKFMGLNQGFMMTMRQKQNNDKITIFQPRGTPTMIVNDKYKVYTGQRVPTYEVMLSVVDHLIGVERAENAPVAEQAETETSADTATN